MRNLRPTSDGYATDDIRLCWHDKTGGTYRESIKLEEGIRLPQFEIIHVHLGNTVAKLTTGDYIRLKAYFVFSRSIGFYLIQIYLPSILIVIISWVSFWLNREATPARVALGVTTVLTMTTLMTTTNSQMPKVSYIKSIDVYLITSFFMVFAALLEYAAVGYVGKKLRMKRERFSKKMAQPKVTFLSHPTKDKAPQKKAFVPSFLNKPTYTMIPETLKPATAHDDHDVECDCDLGLNTYNAEPLRIATPKKKLRKAGFIGISPSQIDKYSRIAFPAFYALFNVAYWIILYKLSEAENQKKLEPKKTGTTPQDDVCFCNPAVFNGTCPSPGSIL